MRAAVVVLTSLTLSACVADQPFESVGAAGGKADGLIAPVQVIDRGEWAVQLGCSGFCVYRYHIWLDVAVRDTAYDKSVGVVWTADDWATVHTSWGHYEGDLDGDYDRWGIDAVVEEADIDSPDLVQAAVFAVVGGVEHWDPGNDYSFWGPAPADTVLLDAGNYRQFPCSGGSGTCAAELWVTANVLGEQDADQAFVRWSRDGWLTFTDSPLSPEGTAGEPYVWSGRPDLRTEAERDEHRFDPDGPIFYKLYAISHGKTVWEAGDNHRLF